MVHILTFLSLYSSLYAAVRDSLDFPDVVSFSRTNQLSDLHEGGQLDVDNADGASNHGSEVKIFLGALCIIPMSLSCKLLNVFWA